MGLPPAAKTTAETVGGPKPQRTVALNRHLAWLKQLQGDMQQARQDAAAEKAAHDFRHEKTHKFCEQARERVRSMRAEAEAHAKEEREKAAAAKSASAAGAAKPKWAMTEKENEEFDEEETCELLDFVDALNFDEYIQDLEFREALDGLKAQVHKLDKAQDVFKKKLAAQFNDAESDDQAASNVGGDPFAEYAAGKADAEKPDWDGSILSESAPSVVSEHKDLAKRVLEENSDMRSVHSAASVARMIEKAQREKAAEAAA